MYLPKKIFSSFLTLFFLFIFTITMQAQSFEGVIHYTFPAAASSKMDEMMYMVKNSKLRMQFGKEDQKGAMLYFPNDSKMVIIMEKMHAYMEWNPDQMGSDDAYSGKWENTTMEKTGQTKTIADHSCEIWEVTNKEDDTLTMCMAKGMGTFVAPGNPMSKGSAPAWAKKISKEGYMPLEVMQNTGSKQELQMRATKIEQKSLDDSLFKIPEGYRDMSAMMKQMQKIKDKH